MKEESVMERSKRALNNYIKENPEKVKEDLRQMRLRSKEQDKRNWFEKLPLHYKLLLHFLVGLLIGLVL